MTPYRALAPALLAAGLALLPWSGAWSQDRAEAEAELAALNRAIVETQEAIAANRDALDRESAALRELELDIQDNLAEQRRLRAEREAQEAERRQLEADRDRHLERLALNREQLAQQVRAAWRLGDQSRLKLVLNLDSPAQLSRTLAYYEFFSQAQAARILDLRDALAGLDAVARELASVIAALEASAARLEDAARALDARRDERTELVQDLDRRIGTDRERLAQLERDRADLEQLLQRLADDLADIPADLGSHLHPTAPRGQLPMPLTGRVLRAFGQSRGAGLRWQGWLVEADAGDEVRAIAYGRVAFADWLRGYGLLIILDHGDGFMSLYGHNEALHFDLGTWVPPGAVIATAGGHGDAGNGLYFELRNGGRAVDPATWIRR